MADRQVAVGFPSPRVVDDGDVIIASLGRGVIIQSPNGKWWRLTVDDLGHLDTTATEVVR